MRTKQSTLIKVGLFVAVGLGLTMMAIFSIGREKALFEKQYTLKTVFSNVSGLRVGAAVQLSGLNVGYVDKIQFLKVDNENRLQIFMKINKDYQSYIHENSMASIQTQGLLGDKLVFLTPGTADAPPLKNNDMLLPDEGNSMESLTQSGQKTLEEIQNVAKKVSQTLDAINKEKLEKIMAHFEDASGNMSTILDNIQEGKGTVGALLMDPSLYFDARALFGHANRNHLLKGLIRATIADQERATAMPLKK
ncbi:MAG: MlaD family protein [Deltaproteobacteria bacterium]|nr:MlaD family protein [Deltaproteobacteria bacterium]